MKWWDESFLHFLIHLYSSRKCIDLKETILLAVTEIHFNKLQLGFFSYLNHVLQFSSSISALLYIPLYVYL